MAQARVFKKVNGANPPYDRLEVSNESQTATTTEAILIGPIDVRGFKRGSIHVANSDTSETITVKIYVSNKASPTAITTNRNDWRQLGGNPDGTVPSDAALTVPVDDATDSGSNFGQFTMTSRWLIITMTGSGTATTAVSGYLLVES